MTIRLLVLASFVLLTACDGDDGTDAGPGTGSDSGPPGDFDAGPGGDTDAGPGGDVDAGPFDVGSCTAAPATIEAACPFMACGGDLQGSWCYTGVCLAQDDLFGGFAGCMASDVDWSGVTGTVTGRAVFDGTTVSRVATTTLTGTLGVPASCVMIPGICAGTVGGLLSTALGPDGSATCAEGTGGGCDCDVTINLGVESTDTYTVNGDQFTADGRTFDYCVGTDGSLSLSETGASAEEPAVQSFSPE